MDTNLACGYLSETYASSLEEFGSPLRLAYSKGWVVQRAIASTGLTDVMGCYPIFCCQDWALLAKDISELDGKLVSFAAVLDPFGDNSVATNRDLWTVATPFKRHYVADLALAPESYVSKHHQYYSRKSLKRITVELCVDPLTYLDEWCRLYDSLSDRHGIDRIRRFSRASFAMQLATPGLLAFRGRLADTTVGMNLIMVHHNVAYTHLSAFSPEGYRERAAYAIRWRVLETLRGRVRWLDLGGTAGKERLNDGLSAFKRGWSSESRVAWFCGRICDRVAYDNLVVRRGVGSDENYFPAYRAGEFDSPGSDRSG
jgi:hypothetical protein